MSSANSPCAACKFQRRKCTQECVFAPYFPPDNPERFVCVHRVFGASNVTKLLKELSAAQRDDAVKSLAYEAEARLRDPVYGCVGFISMLQHRLRQIQTELHNARKELASYVSPQAMQVLLANPGMLPPPPGVLMPHHLHQSVFNDSTGNTNCTMAQPVMVGHGAICDAQQQEFLEAQQLAVVAAAREHQQQNQFVMLRNYEQQQQQQEFVANGFGNQMGAEMLSLGSFENVSPYQMQQQQSEHLVPNHPIEAQLLHTPQQQQQSESEDCARSVGPSS